MIKNIRTIFFGFQKNLNKKNPEKKIKKIFRKIGLGISCFGNLKIVHKKYRELSGDLGGNHLNLFYLIPSFVINYSASGDGLGWSWPEPEPPRPA